MPVTGTLGAYVKLLVAAALFSSGIASQGSATTLFSQTPASLQSAHWSDVDGSQWTYTQFTLAAAGTIQSVTWRGIYMGGDMRPSPIAENFSIAIFTNVGGFLGTEIGLFSIGNSATRNDTGTTYGAFPPNFPGWPLYQYNANINQTLAAGTYWLTIFNNTGNDQDTWAWVGGPVTSGSDLVGFSYSTASIQNNNQGRYVILDGVAATSEVPLPAALPLFATVLAGGGLIAWRRKRKAAGAVR